jgi:hypothetical protein
VFYHTKKRAFQKLKPEKEKNIMKIIIETYNEAQTIIKSNPEMAATPPNIHTENGQPIFFDVILDISGSMKDFYDELVDCFNNIMIPSLKGASERYKGPLRLGCLLFSTKLVPAWYGYKSLDQLGSKPLKRNMLDQDGLQGRTALYGAMRAGVLWTAAAMEHMCETGDGEVPKGKVIVLSDGANNENPHEETSVSNALASIGKINSRNLQTIVGFFNTDNGLTKSEFDTMVKKTGFQGLGFYDIAKGKNATERRKNFRHCFGIFSSASTQ